MLGIHTGILYNDFIKEFKELKAIQLFTHGPKSTKKINIDYTSFKKETKNITVIVHSTYLTNLWSDKKYVLNHCLEQLDACKNIKAKGLVLHLPQLYPHQLIESIQELLNNMKTKKIKQKIILEMTAIGDKNIYATPNQLNDLINTLKKNNITNKQVVICIDTAHVYTGGANIYTYNDAKNYIESIKDKKYIGLVHLNGNEYKYTGKTGDKHALPLDKDDKIWPGISYKDSGCKYIIEWCNKNKVIFILEINCKRHTLVDVRNFLKLL